MEIGELTREARLIRKRIELSDLTSFYGLMGQFPRGCCKLASLSLILHLNRLDVEPLELVANGRRPATGEPPFESHAWVEHRRVIVDIAADQFHDVSQHVLVTYDRGWHDHFEGQARYAFSELSFDDKLVRMYDSLW